MDVNRRFRQLLRSRIANERGVPIEFIKIVRVDTFSRDRWGSVGVVSVNYEPGSPSRADYGFDALAHVSCYAD